MTNEEIAILIKQFEKGLTDDETTVLKEQVTAEPENRNERLWAKNILNVAELIKQHKGIDMAIDMLMEAYKAWNVDHMNAYALKSEILRKT